MRGRILALLLIGAAVAWLVLSYLPADWIPWQVTIDEQTQSVFRWLLLGSAFLFVALQGWLLRSIFRFPQQVDQQSSEQDGRASSSEADAADGSAVIHVRRSWELFWTALPLVASIALFVVSYCALQS